MWFEFKKIAVAEILLLAAGIAKVMLIRKCKFIATSKKKKHKVLAVFNNMLYNYFYFSFI